MPMDFSREVAHSGTTPEARPQARGSQPPRRRPCHAGDGAGDGKGLLNSSSLGLNGCCAVLSGMHDSYESPSPDGRPWAARRPDWAGHNGQDSGPVRSDQPTTPLRRTWRPPPGWGIDGPGQDSPIGAPETVSGAGPAPAGWAAKDPYLGQGSPAQAARGGPPGRHPVGPVARGAAPHYPIPHYPTPPGPLPYHTRKIPPWRAGWADYDPYFGYYHPASAERAAGLRRLSRLTWRAVELSTVAVAGLVVLLARSAQGATSHTAAARPTATPSVHAAVTQQAHKPHKPKRHHHHASSPAAPALAPPSAPPAPQAPPPPPPPPPAPAPAPPPPPVTTSGGSGGG